jgi:hypothetical protein
MLNARLQMELVFALLDGREKNAMKCVPKELTVRIVRKDANARTAQHAILKLAK